MSQLKYYDTVSGTWKVAVIGAKGVTAVTPPITNTGTTEFAVIGINVGTSGGVQAWDADLDAIAGLAGTSGFLKKTGVNTWTLDTNTYLTSVDASALTGTTLASGVVNSSLTKIGALSGGTAGFVKVSNTGALTSDSTTYAPLNDPGLTGTPTSTTAAVDTNTTQIATTAYVIGQASSSTPSALGTAAVGTSTRYARADHVHAMPSLGSIGSVTLTSPSANQFLGYNGTAWVNTSIDGGSA